MQIAFTDCVEIVGDVCPKFIGKKKYISTGTVNVNEIDSSSVEIIEYENKPSRANLCVNQGDILFAKMQATKKVLIIDNELAEYIYSTGFFAVKPKPEYISEDCLFYLLNSNYFLNEKDKYCSGATQKAITLQGLSKIQINLPSIAEQDSLVKKLDTLSSIINCKKKQLVLLDDLIKSRFVELFGTLDYPKQEFKKASLKELCTKITDGKHGGCTQEAGTERYFVGAREIYENTVHYDTAPEINIEEFEKDYKRCNVEIGDFLIVNTGATIGKSAIATDPRTQCTLLQKSVALLKVKRELLNPCFLQYCYKVNEKMYKVESASAQPNLLLSKINSTEIYVPPIELQNRFTSFVEQIDKSKFSVQARLLLIIQIM